MKLYNYARSFGFRGWTRVAFGGIFLALVPLLYVLPSLASGVLFGANIWGKSWLIVPLLAAIWLTADMMLFAHGTRAFWWEFAALGFWMLH